MRFFILSNQRILRVLCFSIASLSSKYDNRINDDIIRIILLLQTQMTLHVAIERKTCELIGNIERRELSSELDE
jgi:hypothetical protein